MTERLLWDGVRAGHKNSVARTQRNLVTSVAFKDAANAMAPPSPMLFPESIIAVMVLFALWCFQR